MKLKKYTVSTLTLILISSNLITANAQSLSDIDNHWAQSTIEKFVNQGYISGYKDETFKPNQNMTRAEFVTILNNVFGLTNKSNKVFNDTKEHWAKESIDIAVTNGVCEGISKTKFNPNGQITREETAAMLANYKKISDYALDKINTFNDKNNISNWAKASVEGVIENGYMGGYPDKTFKPKKSITRAEAVVTLNNVVNPNTTTPKPQPMPVDDMKLPTITYAKEQNVAVTGRGGAKGYRNAVCSPDNKIQGTIYAKYGDPTRGMHTYGCVTQEEYDMVVKFVKDNLKTINFRSEPNWVYLQTYLTKGRQSADYVDNYIYTRPEANNKKETFGDWSSSHAFMFLNFLESKNKEEAAILSTEEAELLEMYNSTISHIFRNIPNSKYDSKAFSAYDTIFRGVRSSESNCQVKLLVADMLGLNASIVTDGNIYGRPLNGPMVNVLAGDCWWLSGTLFDCGKSLNLFNEHRTVLESPTYNLGY
ncbi:S-layer homology domain-containing protein [Romboutsia lituseburensis]|uniref:S-layer homology domain-containing protein n=1 Tax=Romboutsia lituseburensis TaxID=1537 RepID=UPI00215B28E5|nr:S-layer homology domain-containing protein [Romboutsia lituseburensis]MCR8746915.1 S-layer homology domain-containing protein [Romboutsia lituseburensis]